jgi:pectate lyase
LERSDKVVGDRLENPASVEAACLGAVALFKWDLAMTRPHFCPESSPRSGRPAVALLLSSLLFAVAAANLRATETPTPVPERAFPGAEGWTATAGGRGGRIFRVTTLAPTGPGSIMEAINAKGPRIIVFEVGGVIDLGKQRVHVTEPFVTIAGQTAPSPGITFIRQEFQVETHDVIIQHIRIRPGEAGHAKKSGWEADGMSTLSGAHDVVIDHCSFSWATDENLSASGKAFVGQTVAEWREHTSHRITFSNNIIAEGLSRSTHSSGEHSKGSLVMDNVTGVLIVGNLYANNSQRHPLAKGGTWVAVVNNVMYNPGVQAVGYRLPDVLWHDRKFETGKMELVGNVMRAGPDTKKDLPLLTLEGIGDVEVHLQDNINVDRAGKSVPLAARNPAAKGKIIERPEHVYWPPGLHAMPAAQVAESVYKNAGARPWDRDAVDQRIVQQSREGTGRIIDSEQQVGGYPVMAETRQAFSQADWELRTMVRRTAKAQ